MDPNVKALEHLQTIAQGMGRTGDLEIDSADVEELKKLSPPKLMSLGFSRSLANEIGYALADGDLRPLGKFFRMSLSVTKGVPLLAQRASVFRDAP